jgi:hypothetical protein
LKVRIVGQCHCLTPPFGLNIIKHMSVWNKVLLGLFFVGVLVFFHAALRTVKTFDYWSKLANAYEGKIHAVHDQIVLLRRGDPEHPNTKIVGVQQLRFDLARMLANRGRIWPGCTKKNLQTGKDGHMEVTISTDEGLSDKALLYLFEEGDDQSPGKYLGEYAVKAVDKNSNTVVLVSTTQPTQGERNSVQKSNMSWVLYEMMPADQHELFALLGDDLRKKFFSEPDPGVSKAEQAKWKNTLQNGGKWWLPQDFALDGQTVNGKRFDRKLRDYLEVMRVCEVDRTLYDDRLNALQRDETYLSAAKVDSDKQGAFASKLRAQALQEREWEYKERDATAAHYAALQKMLGFNEAAVTSAIAANAEAARQIAKIQKEAAEQIDRRTRNIARYGAGGN